MSKDQFLLVFNFLIILPYEKGQRTDLDGYPNFFGNNPVYWRDIFKPEYSELSWAIKMEFCINEKNNNSIATKLCTNSLNNRSIKLNILVRDTIQWLKCVMDYLNI